MPLALFAGNVHGWRPTAINSVPILPVAARKPVIVIATTFTEDPQARVNKTRAEK